MGGQIKEAMQQNPINTAITQRFYEAIRLLIESKAIRGRQTYCRLHGIDKRNFYRQEHEPTRSIMQLYWIVPLVEQYGINANWLFTGTGQMFQTGTKKGGA